MSTSAAVCFEGIAKDYRLDLLGKRRLQALAGVSFQVEPGEVFGIVGPNRAGKTTLIKVLLSLCRPTAGRVCRLGRPVYDRCTLARVGYLHEHQSFPRYLSAADLLEYYAALTLVPELEARRRVPALLEKVGLADRCHEPISHFSKGMIARLGLAQALVNDPELLVLDEPTEGLDLDGRDLVREVISDQRRRGRTVLFVSHILPEIERLCDRVAVLVKGRLVFLGPMAALTRDPATGESRPLEQTLQELYRGS